MEDENFSSIAERKLSDLYGVGDQRSGQEEIRPRRAMARPEQWPAQSNGPRRAMARAEQWPAQSNGPRRAMDGFQREMGGTALYAGADVIRHMAFEK
jgi:hypothetical protein